MATKEILTRLNKLKAFMLQHPEGLKLKAIIDYMSEDRQVVRKDLDDIGATSPDDNKGMYYYTPTAEEIEIAKAVIDAAKQENNVYKAIHVLPNK